MDGKASGVEPANWAEPDGLAPRGTLIVIGGRGEAPALYERFGRRIASLPGYNFSPALKNLDIVWTPETVAKLFELGPATFTPGTKMPQQTITSADDRAALVRFLQKTTQ